MSQSTENTKYCGGCEYHLPINAFGKDKYRPNGLTTKCKKCRNAVNKEWVKKNPERIKELNDLNKDKRKEYYSRPETKLKYRKAAIEKSFGIPYSEYERMQNEQKNLCAICKKEESSERYDYLAVDHCHSTGIVRGLLCGFCNRGLGLFYDSVENLTEAVNYLNKFKENLTNETESTTCD